MNKISKFLIIFFLLGIISCSTYFVYINYNKLKNNENSEEKKEEENFSEADFYEEANFENSIIFDLISHIEESNFTEAFNLLTNETKKNLFENSVDKFKNVIQSKYYNNDRIEKNILVEDEIDGTDENTYNILFQVDNTDDITEENIDDPLFDSNFFQIIVQNQVDNTKLIEIKFVEINKQLV